MRREGLQETLGISANDITPLQDCGLILHCPGRTASKPKIDYEALAENYRSLLDRMNFSSHAELARHLGVSRVWVSRVLKGIQRRNS